MDNEKLTKIFDLVCDKLIEDLNDRDRRTSGTYQAANRFLEMNGIESLPVPGAKAKQLETHMERTLPFPLKKNGTENN